MHAVDQAVQLGSGDHEPHEACRWLNFSLHSLSAWLLELQHWFSSGTQGVNIATSHPTPLDHHCIRVLWLSPKTYIGSRGKRMGVGEREVRGSDIHPLDSRANRANIAAPANRGGSSGALKASWFSLGPWGHELKIPAIHKG